MTRDAPERRRATAPAPARLDGMEGFLELLRTNPLTALIAATEVGFWILLGTGLFVRYLLKWRRVSNVLLISTPLLDVVLLIATVFDLGRGGTANAAHGLGAAYLGFSVAFGHSVIRWADERVAHRFAGGPPPIKPPGRNDPGRLAYEWREWRKCLLAWAIACGTMLALVFVVGSPERTQALWYWMSRLSTVLLIWLAVGPIWALFSKPDESEQPTQPERLEPLDKAEKRETAWLQHPATSAPPEQSAARWGKPSL